MPRMQGDKMVANAARKDKRELQRRLIASLDHVLPPGAKRHTTVNGAGGRALGVSGRSLHNVLEDVLRFLRTLLKRKARQRPAASDVDATTAGGGLPSARAIPGVPGGAQLDDDAFRLSIMASHSLVAIEVSLPDWSITRVNPGASAFFGSMPPVELTGQCLLNSFVHYDDVSDLQQLWAAAIARTSDAGNPIRIRLLRCQPIHDDVTTSEAGAGTCNSWQGKRGVLAGIKEVSYAYVEAVLVPVSCGWAKGDDARLGCKSKMGAVLLCQPCPQLDRSHTMTLVGLRGLGREASGDVDMQDESDSVLLEQIGADQDLHLGTPVACGDEYHEGTAETVDAFAAQKQRESDDVHRYERLRLMQAAASVHARTRLECMR